MTTTQQEDVPLSECIMDLSAIAQFLLVIIVWDVFRELVIGRLISKWTINQLRDLLKEHKN